VGTAFNHPVHDVRHPGGALAIGSTLTTGLVLVELRKTVRIEARRAARIENRVGLTEENLEIALMTSVLLSMTITAPVPNPEPESFRES
jgi:hypothetical protein